VTEYLRRCTANHYPAHLHDPDSGVVIPILDGGHYKMRDCANVTRAGRKADVLLLGFSSRSCEHCIQFETAYHDAEAGLARIGVCTPAGTCASPISCLHTKV